MIIFTQLLSTFSKNGENVYTNQGHTNSKEIGSPQAKQCINAYHKKSKEKKRAASIKQNNGQQY